MVVPTTDNWEKLFSKIEEVLTKEKHGIAIVSLNFLLILTQIIPT